MVIVSRTTVLVGCGKAKRDTTVVARDIYTSSYFGAKRSFAETADEWYILSAKHGILNPDELTAPYDVTMDDLTDTETNRWVTDVCGDERIRNTDTLVVLAGKSYTTPLKGEPPFVDVYFPFEHTSGLFEQQSWLFDEETTLDGKSITEVLP